MRLEVRLRRRRCRRLSPTPRHLLFGEGVETPQIVRAFKTRNNRSRSRTKQPLFPERTNTPVQSTMFYSPISSNCMQLSLPALNAFEKSTRIFGSFDDFTVGAKSIYSLPPWHFESAIPIASILLL